MAALLKLVLLAFVGTCQGFVMPATGNAVAVRSTAAASPMMFGGGSKAKPVKKVAKKAVKKVVKKVAKKPVAKKVAKKVVKKAKTAGAKTNVGSSAQSFSSSFFTSENWAVQAFNILKDLPNSKPRQAD